jgi:1-deoxy-D-xylulose-5-phosphate synthase
MTLPDVFQDHDSPAKQYETAGLSAQAILQTAINALGHTRASARA